MPLNTNAAPAYSAISTQAFDDQTETLRNRRLANREAMLKVENAMAANGQKIGSVEDWLTLAQQTLGNSAFLNSGAPSVDAVNVILANQNKAAAAAAEKARREQFKADEEERASVEQMIKARFANGDDPVSVYDQAQKLYGVDAVNKLQPNFKFMKSEAERDGINRGIQYGNTMLEDVDAFNEFKQNNPSVPKFELLGMQRAAENKELKRKADIEAIAANVGSTGPITADAAEFEIRSRITPLFGNNANAAKVEKHVKSAVQVALAASQRKLIASQQDTTEAIRKSIGQNYAQEQQYIYKLDEIERERLAALAEKRKKDVLDVQARNVAVVEAALGKTEKASEEVKKKKAEILSAMNSFAFTSGDANLYIDAIMNNDVKEAAKIKARAVPIEVYKEQVDGVTGIITSAHKFTDVNDAFNKLTRLGMSAQDISSIGREYAKNAALVKDVPAQKTPQKKKSQSSFATDFISAFGATSSPYDVMLDDSSVSASVGLPSIADETSATAKMTMDSLLNGFKANVVAFIGDAVDALDSNGSVAADQEQLLAFAKRTATERAAAFVSGLGLSKEEAAKRTEQIATEILNATPAHAPISKKMSPADMFRKTIEDRNAKLLMPQGSVPNAPQAYPTQGASQPPF